MLRTVFSILATVLSIYSTICAIRIILTWFPGAAFSPVTRFLASVCDPFLDLFHGIRFLRIGSLDFSPAAALCLLWVVGTICSHLADSQVLTIGVILALLVQSLWSIISSVITFILILLIVRLIIMLVNHERGGYSANPFMNQLDRTLELITANISRTFAGNNSITYRTGIIITIISLVVLNVLGQLLFNFLTKLVISLPF